MLAVLHVLSSCEIASAVLKLYIAGHLVPRKPAVRSDWRNFGGAAPLRGHSHNPPATYLLLLVTDLRVESEAVASGWMSAIIWGTFIEMVLKQWKKKTQIKYITSTTIFG